jgi:hypothetical protein
VPPHLGNRDPSYFLVSGLVFVACSEPYLESEYGADYASEAPVKLLDKWVRGLREGGAAVLFSGRCCQPRPLHARAPVLRREQGRGKASRGPPRSSGPRA